MTVISQRAVMLPGSENVLDDFFARIGRPRRPDEPAPDPFPLRLMSTTSSEAPSSRRSHLKTRSQAGRISRHDGRIILPVNISP